MIDRQLGMTFKEMYKNAHPEEEKPTPLVIENKAPPILPNISQIIDLPQAPLKSIDKIVSLSITEDIDLKDVLIEISRLADIELELDPEIQGGIILRVKDKPLSQVIERISRLAQLRYNYQDGILKIERDNPYIRSYTMDFLNNTRSINTKSNINTSLVKSSTTTGSGSSPGESSTSGSYNSIANSYDGDLWKSVIGDIKQIIALTGKKFYSNENYLFEKNTSNDLNTDKNHGDKNHNNPDNQNSSNSLLDKYISINKQASVISVYATEAQHRKIQDYLKQVKDSVSSQVLIEAKIVEIQLKDEFRSGINWDTLQSMMGLKTPLNANFPLPLSDQLTGQDAASIFELGTYAKGASGAMMTNGLVSNLNQTNLDSLVQLTSLFGTSRTISSPRVTAMNNQQAVLSFVTNQVYFTLKVENNTIANTTGTTSNLSSIDSTPNTVPIGVILTLQPSINRLTDEVTMSIKPTISSTSSGVKDPSVQYAISQNTSSSTSSNSTPITSEIPVIEIKELDSLLKIKSGKVMIIGGLMQEVSNNQEIGLPFAQSLPLIGNLFKSQQKSTVVIQTVIFIKATIIPTDYTTIEDKRFYNNFGRKFDHTPLF